MLEGVNNAASGSRGTMRAALPTLIGKAALVAALLGATGAQAQDQTLPAYRDDRSTAQTVVESLYNAVERQEYLRAWSYFRDEPGRPSFEAFAAGYENTAHIRLRLGESSDEGAAGSIYTTLPAVIEATDKSGTKAVFAGCYLLRLVQPAMQATPPFIPLGIVKGELKPTQASFPEAQGSCDGIEPGTAK
ncbi:hypothetical protein JYU29_16465 [Tianweitania sp. BSSL-BM11]|uniref:Uncharacterized protein n=1 Tax=Tianweitania aestuarii TaxID=2814886 RepID=A0ABS5RZ17_9HYPH|nr:hypothetical protein [Tianweitania aestuarii]MBS9722290.1 hypothetical protein [Tianweitania aestuarii]